MVDSKPSHECQRHMANWKESKWKCQGKDQEGSGASWSQLPLYMARGEIHWVAAKAFTGKNQVLKRQSSPRDT